MAEGEWFVQYKLVAIDMDGTLLTDDLTVTPGTIETIQKAVAKGAVVTIATGRMFASAKQYARQLQLNVPLITYQGAIVQDMEGTEVLYERPITEAISEQLVDIATKKGLHFQVYQDDQLYSAVENERLKIYAEKVHVPYSIAPDLKTVIGKGFTKGLFIEEPEVLDELTIELREIFGNEVHIAKSRADFLEITHPEANKGDALLHLAKQLNIHPTEIIGIGDNFNDRELIEQAGLGVAMGNAVDEMKAIADYITLSNNDEGVKHVIEKFILEV